MARWGGRRGNKPSHLQTPYRALRREVSLRFGCLAAHRVGAGLRHRLVVLADAGDADAAEAFVLVDDRDPARHAETIGHRQEAWPFRHPLGKGRAGRSRSAAVRAFRVAISTVLGPLRSGRSR